MPSKRRLDPVRSGLEASGIRASSASGIQGDNALTLMRNLAVTVSVSARR